MSKTYVGIKLQDLGLYNTLDPKDKIVIVKDKDEGVLQLKDFFLYVQSNLDLSNYYTSTQADTIFMAKVDAYTRKDADVKFALVEKTYTRTQSDTRFALASDTFNKAEIEGKYASKEQMYTKDLVYTKEESITAFALKTEIPIIPDLTPYSTTAKGDLRWALKVDVFSKTEADARFANINNYYTKSESDNKYALLSNTYTKAETDNKFLDTTEAYTKDYINLNIYTKTQVYTKAETDGKYPLKTDVYTVTAVNDQFAAKSWVYSRAETDNTFRKLADSYNRAEVNALIDASKSGLSTDVSNTYYTKTDTDAKFELKGTAYNKIDSDAKYALISNSISPSQVAAKYYNKTEIDKSLGDAATNTSNLFALKTAAVGGISLTPTNLTFTKVDGTSSLVAIPTWNQSTTGNAATATKFQTARTIGITGAVTAAGIAFDGTSNININATSLDATKLTGIVPNASLTGLYSNMDIQLNNNRTIYTTNSSAGRTVYGLADFQYSGAFTGCVVFKTTIPKNNNTMFQLHISGMLYGDGILDTIVKTYQFQGDLKTSGARISRGTADVLIRFGATPDGYICIIIGDVGKGWYFPHISITHGVLSSGIADNYDYVKGWTSYNTNDLTGYTMITTPYVNELSVANVAWGNVQNKPTTVSGYGITDAYTKSDIYTKTESDNRFSYKQESIKSATLNTSILSFTKADNTVSNISIPTWNQDTSGNSATATKLKTPRTINGVSFDGSSNITTPAYTSLYSLEYRGIKPYQVTTAAMSTYFVDRGRMEIGEDTYNYSDLVVFNSWNDASGGNLNALLFGKSAGQGIWHYFTGQNSTTWGTAKQLAYTDSNITGNAASASKWQTARTFNITGDASWSASVDGGSDITGTLTLANTGVNPGTYTKVTVDSKGRTTAASNLVPADIPNLDMSKVNTGVLGISQGGTAATTAATARTNLGLGTSAVLNVGAVNGVASLDASGKVPTSQLYINNTLTSTDTTVPLTAAQGKVLNDSIGTTNTNLQTLTNRLDTNYYLKSDVFTKAEITTNYFDKTYVNNNFLAQAANKDVSIAGFINAGKDLLFTTSLTGIKWNMNTDNASIVFKNNGDDDTDSYLGFDVGDNGDEYFRWSFSASSSNKIAMSLKRDKLEINNNVATLGLSTSATLTDISKIPQYGIYSKGNIKTDGQIITNATSHHVNISDLATGNDSPIRIPDYLIPMGQTGYIPFLHGSVRTITNGFTMHSSLGVYRANNTWNDGGMYMAIGGDDRYPTVAFRFKLDGTIDFTGGSVNLVGNTSSATKLQTARTISLTGDGSWSTTFDGTGNSTGTFVLSNSGVTAGTYTKVTVDTKGRVTSGTGLAAGDIPTIDMSKVTTGILPVAQGGTGSSNAGTARNNLGLGSAAVYNVGISAGQIRTNDMMVDISNAWNSSADGDKFTTSIPTNGNIFTPVAFGNVGTLDYGAGMARRYIFENSEYVMGWSHGLFNGYMYRFYAKRDTSTNKWTQYTAVVLDTFNSSTTNIQFNTIKVVSPAATTALPNTFIEPSTGEIKKSTTSFGPLATASVVPVANGGTGATDAAGARNNLGLTAAATTAITTNRYTGGIGNVMRVGDFGLGGDSLLQQLDGNFNDYKQNGFYTVNNASNSPENKSGAWFNVITLAHNPNYGTQIASQMTDNRDIPYTYIRTQFGSAWKPWVKVALQGLDASFTSLQMTSPSNHAAAPNMFIDTDGVIKKTSYVIGTAASKNIGTSNGDVMTVGSFGLGSGTGLIMSETDVPRPISLLAGKTQTFKNNAINPATIQYGAGWYVKSADVAFGLTVSPKSAGIKIFAHDDGNVTNPVIYTVYNDVTMPNENVTVKSITIKNLTGPTDAAPNLYWGSDGKIYNSSESALLKSQADAYYLPINRSWLNSLDTRSLGSLVPNKMPNKGGGFYFAEGTASGFNLGYTDVIWLSTYPDASAGGVNALVLGKDPNNPILKHATGPFNGTGWTNVKTVAYTDSNITGNAATATKLQTARTINGVAFDGTANITVTDNTKLPTTGGTLTGNVVFTNTNTGIRWDMNTDMAGIYFKNTGDADSDSYLMFSVGDNGNEYFRWGNSQDTNLMSLKNGFLKVRDSVTTDTVYARNISLTNDLVATNNITSKNLYGNLLLNNGDSVIRDIGTNGGSVFYGIVNSTFSDDAEGYIVIQTNIIEFRRGMFGITIDVYQSYGGQGGKIYIQFYRYGGWYGANYNIEGNMDVPVRLGVLDGKIAIILGSAWWANAQIAVTKVLAHYVYNEDDLLGWSVSRVTDISGYTGVAVISEATSSIKTNWNKMVNKPTTVSGYGITDAYTKTEADSRYTIVDSPVIYTSVPSRVQYNRPMVLDGYGLQSHRTIWITANNDSNSVPEPVIITSGKGHYPSADMGLSVYPDVVNFFGDNNWWNSSGNVNVSGTVTAGYSVTSSSATCAWLINTNADYHSDNLHKFRTTNGTPQKVAAGGLLVSDSFGDTGNVPFNGIWAKGDIKSGAWIYSTGRVIAGTNIQAGGSITAQGDVNANGVRTTDIVVSTTATIANATVSGSITVPDQSIISSDANVVNTGTANTKIRYALDYSPATAAAWINFSYMYDSTAGTNVITVKSSYNISNITRIGTGIYKVEFLRAFENEHFVMAGFARDDDGGGDVIIGQQSNQVFTSTTAVFSVASGSGNKMPTSPVCTVLFFGKRYGGAWLL